MAEIAFSENIRRYIEGCPCCGSKDILTFAELTYNETFTKWGFGLAAHANLQKVLKINAEDYIFKINMCPACGFTYVSNSYQGLVEYIEGHPIYLQRIISDWVKNAHPFINDDFVQRCLQQSWDELSPWHKRFRLSFYVLSKYQHLFHHILDVGANYGSLSEFLRLSLHKKVSSIEINTYAADVFESRYPYIPLYRVPLNQLSTEIKFDCIYCVDVIEHIWELEQFIQSLVSHISLNGLLFIVTPNGFCKESQEQGKEWWGYIVPHHAQLFSITSLEKLLIRFGFVKVQDGLFEQEFYGLYSYVANNI